jgi:hypothetical protein
MKLTHDRNGNRFLRIRGMRGIQTNGNLPRTHRDGVGPWTEAEVSDYVKRYGSKGQRLAWTGGAR